MVSSESVVANQIIDFQPQIDFLTLWLIKYDFEVISLICSWWTTYGVTTFTVVTFPSILAITNDFLAMGPYIWGFSAIPLTCWCWHGSRRQWGCQIDRWRCCWRCRRRRWRWCRHITCHRIRRLDSWLNYVDHMTFQISIVIVICYLMEQRFHLCLLFVVHCSCNESRAWY